jgi:hypothetical protein
MQVMKDVDFIKSGMCVLVDEKQKQETLEQLREDCG